VASDAAPIGHGGAFPVPPAATLTQTRTLLIAASASLTGLGLAAAADIEDLIARLASGRASVRYATTPMAIKLIARELRGRPGPARPGP